MLEGAVTGGGDTSSRTRPMSKVGKPNLGWHVAKPLDDAHFNTQGKCTKFQLFYPPPLPQKKKLLTKCIWNVTFSAYPQGKIPKFQLFYQIIAINK